MKLLRDKPWIWVIVAHLMIVGVLTTMVIISRKYGVAEVSVPAKPHGH